jgi:predicted CXXCH cytochrome family protein
MDVRIALPKGRNLRKLDIDKDGNNLVDEKEWESLIARLNKEYRKPVSVKKIFLVKGSTHEVTGRSIDCHACHGGKSLFKDATLSISDGGSLKLPIKNRIFVSELPDIKKYEHTLHGEKGVACRDCHISQERMDDSVCARCHQGPYNAYKASSHAVKRAAQCTDCHNPHGVVPYAGLTAEERVGICARCHRDYTIKHSWLPNTMLHFKYLECSSCHSPGSTKSIVFHLAVEKYGRQIPIDRQDIEKAYGSNIDIRNVIDKDRDNAITSDELSDFFIDVSERLKQPLSVGSSIITTKVHHDYSVKQMRDKLCSACHSDSAPFYDSMFLLLPGKTGQIRIPVKGTVLSALPTSVFIDMCLLGETKIKKADWQNIMRASGKKRTDYIRELGFKWIDFGGVIIILVVIILIGLHIFGRIMFKR